MKYFIFTAILLLSFPAMAFDLFGSSKYETKLPELQKYLDFVKKDGRCDLAVAIIPRSSATKILKGIYERYPSILRCVGDLTFHEGTIKEFSGCTAFHLSPTNKLMSSFVPPSYGGDYNVTKGKKCSATFDELVKTPLGPMIRLEVGKVLSGEEGYGGTPLFGGRGADFESESFLIYSTDQKYTDWYFKEKKAMEANFKAAYPKAKAEGKLNTYANGETIKAPVTDEKMP